VLGQAAPAAAVPEIAPHNAVYKLSLKNARASSQVAGVDGLMSFSWKDACTGWTVEQRFDVTFTYAEGEAVSFSTNYVTWESKSGDSYRFNVRKLINGEVDEDLKGEASLEGEAGGTVRFSQPEEKVLPLQAGTLFPTAHTVRLIAMAEEGEPFFSAPVFDGSEFAGAAPVSAVIGARQKPPTDADQALRRAPGWPVHMAFFPADPMEALPEYETAMTLLANGVVRGMVIDYGDFQVDVTLEKLEGAPAPRC